MFWNIFGKNTQLKDPDSPFSFRDELILNWSPDSEGWVAPISQINEKAEIYIGPEKDFDNPSDFTCELVLDVLKNIERLVEEASAYLCHEILKTERFKESLVLKDNLRVTGLQIFEHEKTPEEYSLTFDPTFDSGAIYKVRLKSEEILGWGFDD